jgi:hypothetical protein
MADEDFWRCWDQRETDARRYAKYSAKMPALADLVVPTKQRKSELEDRRWREDRRHDNLMLSMEGLLMAADGLWRMPGSRRRVAKDEFYQFMEERRAAEAVAAGMDLLAEQERIIERQAVFRTDKEHDLVRMARAARLVEQEESMAEEDISRQEALPEANAHGSLVEGESKVEEASLSILAEEEVSKKEDNHPLQIARGEDDHETRAGRDSHEAMPHEESKMGRGRQHGLSAKQQVARSTRIQDGPRTGRCRRDAIRFLHDPGWPAGHWNML